jgi:hypothetical protein
LTGGIKIACGNFLILPALSNKVVEKYKLLQFGFALTFEP